MSKKIDFSAELKTKDGYVNAKLELFTFKENGMSIVYCPAIDLSAYGKTEVEAENEFKEVFRMHISYCLAEKTLAQDLRKYGWSIKEKQKKVVSPSIEKMLLSNETLKDIIFNKDYTKVSRALEIPQFA